MTGTAVEELARQLRADYDSAPVGKQVLSIHLFAIRHADALRGVNPATVAERAGLSATYGTEIRKGIRLSEHVVISKPLV